MEKSLALAMEFALTLRRVLKILIAIVLYFSLLVPMDVFAWDPSQVAFLKRYSYLNGHRSSAVWFWVGAVNSIVYRSIMKPVPPGNKVIVVNGITYYYDGTYYYQSYPGGYVVVENPTVNMASKTSGR